jgi:hypothetical protein
MMFIRAAVVTTHKNCFSKKRWYAKTVTGRTTYTIFYDAARLYQFKCSMLSVLLGIDKLYSLGPKATTYSYMYR